MKQEKEAKAHHKGPANHVCLPKGSGKALNSFESGEVYTRAFQRALFSARCSRDGGVGQHLRFKDTLGGPCRHQC